MIAFTEKLCIRTTRVFGTLGELHCDDGNTVSHYDFLTNAKVQKKCMKSAIIILFEKM